MSSENGKKRKLHSDGVEGSDGSDGLGAVVPTQDMMAEMRAMLEQTNSHMIRMQNKIDTMQQRYESETEAMKSQHEKEIVTLKIELKQSATKQGKLEDRCDYLESRCNSLERSLKVLAKDVKWEYSAPDITENHWIDQGHTRVYASKMDTLVTSLKRMTHEMRSGKSSASSITVGQDIYENDGPMIVRDDRLLPHWREFTDSIHLHDGFDGSGSLVFSGIELHQQLLDMLVTALKTKDFETLRFDKIGFSTLRGAIDFAVELIQNNPSLSTFEWGDTNIDTIDDARCLLESIADNKTIKSVRLENCFGGTARNNYYVLCLLLTHNKTLECIDLDRNNIDTLGGTHLPDFLATNPPLRELHLEFNNLYDSDAALIALALKRNTNLTYLDLFGNNITEAGRSSLCEVMFDTRDLNAAATSNHTCYIRGIALDDSVKDNLRGRPYENRARKIYSILSARNTNGSNVHHLNLEFGVESLKLVPKVLECVHTYYSKQLKYEMEDPLSILYEILRSWKMPELYAG